MSQAPRCKHGEPERGVYCKKCHTAEPSKETRFSNMLYTALREHRPLPDELKGTGLGDEIQWLLDTIANLRKQNESLEGAMHHPADPNHTCLFKDTLEKVLLQIESGYTVDACCEIKTLLDKKI